MWVRQTLGSQWVQQISGTQQYHHQQNRIIPLKYQRQTSTSTTTRRSLKLMTRTQRISQSPARLLHFHSHARLRYLRGCRCIRRGMMGGGMYFRFCLLRLWREGRWKMRRRRRRRRQSRTSACQNVFLFLLGMYRSRARPRRQRVQRAEAEGGYRVDDVRKGLARRWLLYPPRGNLSMLSCRQGWGLGLGETRMGRLGT